MRRFLIIFIGLIVPFAGCKKDKIDAIVYLVGDSTVSPHGSYPITGWGQVLYKHFKSTVDIRD